MLWNINNMKSPIFCWNNKSHDEFSNPMHEQCSTKCACDTPGDITHQRWNALPPNMLKLSVDDSGQDDACAAVACRDSQDRVKTWRRYESGYTGPGPCWSKRNTSWTETSYSLTDTSCIIVSDEKNLVHWICSKESMPSWRITHVICECRNVLQDNTRAKRKFSGRAMNEAAHLTGRRCLNHHFLVNDCMSLFLLFIRWAIHQFM